MNGITLKTWDGRERTFTGLAEANKWARRQLNTADVKIEKLDAQRDKLTAFKAYLEEQLGVRRRSQPSAMVANDAAKTGDAKGVKQDDKPL